jgi:RTX calcium-binding nonapeptide repeat (4 copies)
VTAGRREPRAAGAAACAAAAVAATVAIAGSASAGFVQPEIACAYDPVTRVVTVNYGDPAAPDPSSQLPSLLLVRDGKELLFREVTGGEIDTRPCTGGTPTVSNTDRIELRRIADPLLGTLTFIDVTGGPIAPGATPENGGSEIEIDADLGEEPSFDLTGTKRGDYWVFGSAGDRHQVNLNPAEKSPDADLAVHGAPEEFFMSGSPGDDRWLASGGKGTGGPLGVHIGAGGGAGDDTLAGGDADDYFQGDHGRDRISGGAGDDRIDLYGAQGRDRLDCGPGDDRAGVRRKDRARGCEHT